MMSLAGAERRYARLGDRMATMSYKYAALDSAERATLSAIHAELDQLETLISNMKQCNRAVEKYEREYMK